MREEEELALRQTISGILPEWQEKDTKKKSGVVTQLKLWTGEMMNCARIHMKMWITIKNEYEAEVQRRWIIGGKCVRHSRVGKREVWPEYCIQIGRKEDRERGKEREKTYGIKYWGRVRSVPKLHTQFQYAGSSKHQISCYLLVYLAVLSRCAARCGAASHVVSCGHAQAMAKS
eukprot:6200384-Pleurochrysis_carterae.AAC.4